MDKFPEPLMYTVWFDHDPLEVPAKPTVDLFTVNPVGDDACDAFPRIIILVVGASFVAGYVFSVRVKENFFKSMQLTEFIKSSNRLFI